MYAVFHGVMKNPMDIGNCVFESTLAKVPNFIYHYNLGYTGMVLIL